MRAQLLHAVGITSCQYTFIFSGKYPKDLYFRTFNGWQSELFVKVKLL